MGCFLSPRRSFNIAESNILLLSALLCYYPTLLCLKLLCRSLLPNGNDLWQTMANVWSEWKSTFPLVVYFRLSSLPACFWDLGLSTILHSIQSLLQHSANLCWTDEYLLFDSPLHPAVDAIRHVSDIKSLRWKELSEYTTKIGSVCCPCNDLNLKLMMLMECRFWSFSRCEFAVWSSAVELVCLKSHLITICFLDTHSRPFVHLSSLWL